MYAKTRFRGIEVLFYIFYYSWERNIVHYTEDFIILKFVKSTLHCIVQTTSSFIYISVSLPNTEVFYLLTKVRSFVLLFAYKCFCLKTKMKYSPFV